MKTPDTDRLSRKLVHAEEFPAYELSDDNEYKAAEGFNDLIREHLAGVRNMRRGEGKKE